MNPACEFKSPSLEPLSLVPIYWTHIIFAYDLWHSQIEYLSNSIDLNRKDRAKPPARRGCTPTPRRAIPQIFNRQYSISACPGWGNDIIIANFSNN